MTHNAAEDGFHEIQLSGKQLVALFMIATTVFVFIFLCGVLVGRNLRDGEAIGAGSAFAASAPAGQSEQPAAMQPADPPTPADTVDELTYHRRLQGEDTEPPAPEPEQTPAPQPEQTPAPEPQPPAPAAAAPPADTAPADVPASGRPGRFIVQVFASQNSRAAASVVRQLVTKGYPAFLVRPAAGDDRPLFRVQVGRYEERREAEAVSRRIEKEEQFKPWISSR